MTRPLKLHNFEPETENLRDEVLRGLERNPKELPCKLFYDQSGSRLFEEICKLDEYYPTRTEIAIMNKYAGEMVGLIGKGCMLIEYGSGSSKKTRILLDHLSEPAAYVPIDISKEHLMRSAAEIAADYPGLDVIPICADYSSYFELPASAKKVSRRLVFFPGSTIGNFHPPLAVDFLRRIARVCGVNGGLLIGVDLKKDPRILHRAYNDRMGVTAAFNLNILSRLNNELNADFSLDRFAHRAFYNQFRGRIEMHLVSLSDQTVHLDGVSIPFRKDETIWTESSYKYTIEEFEKLGTRAGFGVKKVWTDRNKLFSVQYLVT